jgi:DNA-binding transcriptional MerR regulator
LYEERGLIQPASRSKGGYRLYDESNLVRIGFIDRLQKVGLSLAEIQSLMDGWRSAKAPQAGMKEVESAFREQLSEVQSKIMELKALEKDLLDSLDYMTGCSSCVDDGDTESVCHHCVRSKSIEEGPSLILGLTAH